MGCDISEEQLWSWVDREAPELAEHIAACPRCRQLAQAWRSGIRAVVAGSILEAPPLPERVGTYAIRRLIGEGGQALVYEAEQPAPRRTVALKVLRGGRFVTPQDVKLFQREIQTLAALQHPGIATIFDAGRTEEGQYYFAMEYVHGAPLDAHLRRYEPPLAERLALFCKVCDGVEYAHEQGVIHRDLKPTNILVNEAGEPRVLDFGLARVTNADITLATTATRSGGLVGTLRYMSPEQTRGISAAVDQRSDVYALGVILYEVLTGQPPYQVGTFVPDAVHTICEQPPQRPSGILLSLRGDLEAIVLTALEKDPARRYPTAAALAADVRRYLAGEPVTARRPGAWRTAWRRLRQHGGISILTTAAVALALVGLWGGAQWRDRDAQRQQTRAYAAARDQILGVQVDLDLDQSWPDDVLARAQALTVQYPTLPEVHLTLAQACLCHARAFSKEASVEAAVTHLRSVVATETCAWACQALLAEIAVAVGRTGSLDEADAARARGPDTAEGWYLRSYTTLSHERAREFLTLAVARDNRHWLAWERLAYLHCLDGSPDEALRAGRRLRELAGERGYKWELFEGHLALRERQYARAADVYNAILNSAGRSTADLRHAQRFRAIAELCLGDYEAACRDYDVTIVQWPGDSRWEHYYRATPRWITGDLAGAVEDYQQAIRMRMQPSYADIRLSLLLHDWARRLAAAGQHTAADEKRAAADAVFQVAARGVVSGGWLAQICACLAGTLSAADLVALGRRTGPEEECEACYYAGERCLLVGDHAAARDLFAACVATDVVFDLNYFSPTPMNEWHLAHWRLATLTTEANVTVADP